MIKKIVLAAFIFAFTMPAAAQTTVPAPSAGSSGGSSGSDVIVQPCTTDMVWGRNVETGEIKYGFSSSCMPKGWVYYTPPPAETTPGQDSGTSPTPRSGVSPAPGGMTVPAPGGTEEIRETTGGSGGGSGYDPTTGEPLELLIRFNQGVPYDEQYTFVKQLGSVKFGSIELKRHETKWEPATWYDIWFNSKKTLENAYLIAKNDTRVVDAVVIIMAYTSQPKISPTPKAKNDPTPTPRMDIAPAPGQVKVSPAPVTSSGGSGSGYSGEADPRLLLMVKFRGGLSVTEREQIAKELGAVKFKDWFGDEQTGRWYKLIFDSVERSTAAQAIAQKDPRILNAELDQICKDCMIPVTQGVTNRILPQSGVVAVEAQMKADTEKRQIAIVQSQNQVQIKQQQTKPQLEVKLNTVVKSETKKKIVTDINNKLTDINLRLSRQMAQRLDKIQAILGEISTLGAQAALSGKDITVLQADIDAARSAVTTASAAVTAQAGKTYPITVTTEANLKTDVVSVSSKLKDDLNVTQSLINTAQQAVQSAAQELSSIK